MREAIENEYVQPLRLEQTKNEITMRIEYVIVDQKQLNIFYSLQSPKYTRMDATPAISDLDGKPLEGYSIISNSYDAKNGEILHFTVDFTDRNMPGSMMLSCKVHDNGSNDMRAPVQVDANETEGNKEPASITTFTFALHFDPDYTNQGEIINLNQGFVLDGQHLTATTVEIYPTHIRLNLADDKKQYSVA